jgi:hypothetical protein
LSISGYYDENPVGDTDFPGTGANPSYAKKRAIIHGGEYFIGTINLGLFRQELKIPGFVQMRLIFTRAGDDFIIDNTTKAKLKCTFEKMFIQTRQVTVVPSVYNAHVQTLKTQNFMYHINREVVVRKTLTNGNVDGSWDAIFTAGQLPKIVVMTMVHGEAFTGHGRYDPFNFQHFDLAECQLSVNNDPSNPVAVPYKPEWTNNGFLREYHTLNSIGGQTNMCGITRNAFTKGRFFLVWNLCPDKLTNGAAEIVKPGTVGCSLRFKNPLTHGVSILFYGIFDNTIEITHDKVVIRNWSV